MRINHLEKTFENVIANIANDVYFLKATRSTPRSTNVNYQFTSKRIQTVALEDIQGYLDDPNVALVTIELE